VTVPDWVNDLTTLEFAKTYWINVSQTITLQVTGGGPQPALGTAALPSPPATFYGAVQPGTGFTPAAGMVVTAWIGGNACGQGKTLLVSGQVMYTINVLPEGPGGSTGCGAPGRTITFKVGAQTMTTTAPQTLSVGAVCNRDPRGYKPLPLRYRKCAHVQRTRAAAKRVRRTFVPSFGMTGEVAAKVSAPFPGA